MCLTMGINAYLSENISYKNTVITGFEAQMGGILFTVFGLITLFYLLFKAEKDELKNPRFGKLEEFDEIHDGFKVKFAIEDTHVGGAGNSGTAAFYYVFKIYFNEELNINLDIKQRNKVEYFFWRIGIARLFDTLTGLYGFDSKYHVNVSDKKLFKQIFTNQILQDLHIFDQEETLIRSDEGILYIFDSHIAYLEGPYKEEYKIFNPHRGDLTVIYDKLIRIIKQIQHNKSIIGENNV